MATVLTLKLVLGTIGAEASPGAWQYRLIEGSECVDDCTICDRPTLQLPLRGRFTLELVEETPIRSRYKLREIDFHTGTGAEGDYQLRGTGTFEVGGEVVLRQEMRLALRIATSGSTLDRVFTNEAVTVSRAWPMLAINLNDTAGTPLQVYRLVLRAAPFREIWLSTVNAMTSSISEPPFQRLTGGDLLSGEGRVVRSNRDLLGRLGFMPPIPEIGIDAYAVEPEGEIWFSLSDSMFSETLGMLQEGDLLSERRGVVKRNQDLTGAFRFADEPLDHGLDGLWLVTDVAPGPGQRPTLGLPRLTTAADREIELHWDGPGRVFQAEQASEPAGPYVAASPILAAREWRQQTGPPGGARFYRVRQW